MTKNHTNTEVRKKTIGILGGMGPLASANLYHKIVKIAQENYGAEQDTDFPPMIINSIALSGFDETGVTNPDEVTKQLIAGVQTLERAGSDFIIIACNTVHCFFQEMQEAVHIPIMSILEETAKAVASNNIKTVGLLSSETTNQLGIYQRVFDSYNIASFSVTAAQQEQINQVILNVMSGVQGESDITSLNSIINELHEKGAEGIVLGCTELPLAISDQDTQLPLFDSTYLISKAALKYALLS